MELKYVTEISFNKGTKFEVYKEPEGLYPIRYFEYFADCGWRSCLPDEVHYTRDAVKAMLGEDIFNF